MDDPVWKRLLDPEEQKYAETAEMFAISDIVI